MATPAVGPLTPIPRAEQFGPLATIRELSRSDSNRMLSTGTSTVARYPIRWLWLADYTLDGCDRPLNSRVHSTEQSEKTDRR